MSKYKVNVGFHNLKIGRKLAGDLVDESPEAYKLWTEGYLSKVVEEEQPEEYKTKVVHKEPVKASKKKVVKKINKKARK